MAAIWGFPGFAPVASRVASQKALPWDDSAGVAHSGVATLGHIGSLHACNTS